VASDPYCSGAHPDGWLCILRAGHDGVHLSLDNRQRWRGTVGLPVRWRADVVDLPTLPDSGAADDVVDGLRGGGAGLPPGPADARGLDSPGGPPATGDSPPATAAPATWAPAPTGDACGVCGRLEVVRETACRTRCRACGAIDGGCG